MRKRDLSSEDVSAFCEAACSFLEGSFGSGTIGSSAFELCFSTCAEGAV
jgi:hypothetical protein